MQDDKIKDAFSKVKQDIDDLKSHLYFIRLELTELKSLLKISTDRPFSTDTPLFPLDTSTDTSTNTNPFYGLKSPNSQISTGNKGVSTDRQTDQQTDTYTNTTGKVRLNNTEEVSKLLESLTELKQDIREKFKKTTKQELAIFSAIYQLQEQGEFVDYSILASKFNISESSIRDHVQSLIRKGIPIDKVKENNKKVFLSIPETLKKATTLDSIIKLRDSK